MDTNSDDSAKKNIGIVKIKDLREILIYLCLMNSSLTKDIEMDDIANVDETEQISMIKSE